MRVLNFALLSAATLFTTAISFPALAEVYNISVDRVTIDIENGTKSGIGFNGASPGPTLRFKEGEEVTINVTNNLNESTSIHWHGLILPFQMDGVPGFSYDGIDPGETFVYQFPIKQSGTYWFHSHSGFQEPDGAYGSIIIEPKGREPFKYDRDYVVQLSDQNPHSGDRIMRNLKKMPDYYNRTQRTLLDFFKDSSEQGAGAAISDRRAWGSMRMMRTDIEDVQGYTPLINGKTPDQNWTGLFKPGERVRLRFINSSAMAFFDIRIPGLELLVVQADGNNVRPVKVDEFRIAVAETYDVIVRPKEDRAYSIIAESMGRTAMGRGTLAPREGMVAEVPALRDAPLLTMADMRLDPLMAAAMGDGMMMGDGMKMADGMPMKDGMKMADGMPMKDGMKMADGMPMKDGMKKADGMPMKDGMKMADGMPMKDGMKMADGMPMKDGMKMADGMPMKDGMKMADGMPMKDGMKMADGMPMKDGMKMADGMAMNSDLPPGAHQMSDGSIMGGPSEDPFYAQGSGLKPVAAKKGGKFLSYKDLKALKPLYPLREATREIELRLTGNMERYSWSINNVRFEDAEPIRLKYGERVRFKFVNETMMTHPMHLHGMWSILDNGSGKFNPVKHTISVSPGTIVTMETEVDAPGQWAFHCHLSYHADAGMFRKVIVEGGPDTASLPDDTTIAMSSEE